MNLLFCALDSLQTTFFAVKYKQAYTITAYWSMTINRYFFLHLSRGVHPSSAPRSNLPQVAPTLPFPPFPFPISTPFFVPFFPHFFPSPEIQLEGLGSAVNYPSGAPVANTPLHLSKIDVRNKHNISSITSMLNWVYNYRSQIRPVSWCRSYTYCNWTSFNLWVL